MKTDQLGAVVVKSGSILTGSFVAHSVETTSNGSVIEKYVILLGAGTVEFSIWAAKGLGAEQVKTPEWTKQRLPVVVVVNPDFKADVWNGRAQLRATCDSVDVLSP